MSEIALEGMEFFGRHGVYAEEQERGNTFVVDVYLWLGNSPDSSLPESDNVDDALDYARVYQVVSDAMKERANLLETLVLRIGKGLEEHIAGWKKARVRVSKLNPPLSSPVKRSYVEEHFLAKR